MGMNVSNRIVEYFEARPNWSCIRLRPVQAVVVQFVKSNRSCESGLACEKLVNGAAATVLDPANLGFTENQKFDTDHQPV